MKNGRAIFLTFLALSALWAVPAGAQAPRVRRCFSTTEFDSWRAADAKTMYIRVRPNRYYRLDFANECSQLLWPDSHLILQVHGPNSICSAIDWDLSVAPAGPGIPEHCIVKAMTRLSAVEAAALPKKVKP